MPKVVRMSCPNFKMCIETSINEKEICTDRWTECSIYLKKVEIEKEVQRLREMRNTLEEMLQTKSNENPKGRQMLQLNYDPVYCDFILRRNY